MNKTDISNLIKDLIEKIFDKEVEVSVSIEPVAENSNMEWFAVKVDDPNRFFSRDNEAVLALNHIVRRMVESKIKTISQDEEVEASVLIDINGFQKKKIENLKSLVHMMAERARYFKSNIEIEPMPSFERRIVHEFLSNASDLKTESEGFGRNRRVIIKYIGSI